MRKITISIVALSVGLVGWSGIAQETEGDLPASVRDFIAWVGADPEAVMRQGQRFSYAFMPTVEQVLNPEFRQTGKAYDLWGRWITAEEAAGMDPEALSPAAGAVRIDDDLLRLGQEAFYKNTFGNEYVLTDLLGAGRGAITVEGLLEAIADLDGAGTTNLRVPVAGDASIGGMSFAAGDLLDTGLDVAPGAPLPLGISLEIAEGQHRVGITCALCHSAYDPESDKVIHGAVNRNLQVGVLFASGTNSASFLIHSSVDLDEIPRDEHRTVTTSDGRDVPLPNIAALEEAIEFQMLNMVPGSNNTTPDLQANPGRIPDSFTFMEHPFNWTGSRMAGPFNGLTTLNNTVHAVGSDPVSTFASVPALIEMDPELYLAILLQNAAADYLRWTPESGLSPTEFLALVKPTIGVGLNHTETLPSYPQRSLLSDLGVAAVTPGVPFWQEMNAMSAWQDHLLPPINPIRLPIERAREGRAVFEAAGCATCHSGPVLTNNRVVPLAEIGTNPARAVWPRPIESEPAEPQLYAFDELVPLREDARVLDVPTDHLDPEQLALAQPGDDPAEQGYATPGLLGLYYSAPYLHDGGVAVGPEGELGMANTLMAGVDPDPRESLRALVDRALRERVIEANTADRWTAAQNVTGEGHAYWVDETSGFSSEQQEALLDYLLALPLSDDIDGALAE